MEKMIFLKIFLTILGIVLSLCLIATHAGRLREVTLHFFQIFYLPLLSIATWCREFLMSVINWSKVQMNSESQENSNQHVIYHLAGCILYTIFLVLFCYCDLGLIAQTIEAYWGLHLPIQISEPALAMAVSLLVVSVAWGIILFDLLGVTHLAPGLENMPNLLKKIVLSICGIFIIVTLISFIALLYLQSWSIINSMYTETSADQIELSDIRLSDADSLDQIMVQLEEPETDKDAHPPQWITYVSRICSGVSVFACTFVCGIAAIPVFKWAILGICIFFMLPVVVVWAAAGMIATIVNLLSGFAVNFLDLLVDLGNSILSKFPRPETRRKNNQKEDLDNSDHHNESVIAEANIPSKDMSLDEESQETNFNEIKNSKMGFDPFG